MVMHYKWEHEKGLIYAVQYIENLLWSVGWDIDQKRFMKISTRDSGRHIN